MSGLVEEIEKHLTEARQRFDALEHAMVELADLVEQLIQKSAKNERDNIHKVQSPA